MSFINKLAHWYFSKQAIPYWCILIMDCAIVVVSCMFSFYILNGGTAVANNFWHLIAYSLIVAAAIAIFFKVFHTYSGVVRYSSFVDLWRIAVACICGGALYFVGVSLCRYLSVPLTIVPLQSFVGVLLVCCFSIVLMAISRILVKLVYDSYRTTVNAKGTFVYGVKSGGVGVAKSIRNADPVRFVLKGFVDPDPENDLEFLMGVRVFKDDDKLLTEIKHNHVQAVIVSPLQIYHFTHRENLVDTLIENNIQIFMVAEPEEWDGKSDLEAGSMHPVKIEDLLPRSKIEVDMEKIGAFLTGKVVMITGAAGSIGSEMVRQVAFYKPKHLVLIDQAETPMHDVRLMLARDFADVSAETIVTSITNRGHMEAIFKNETPDYVFHAAAYKHVPMMEDNPAEAVQNNVVGTRVIADLAVKYGTKKFVMISTDKAVNPTNVMGCSKRICEIYCQSLNQAIVEGKVKGVTQFVTTRFGNVLGSNGSVIPLFREQIAKGGPVTVTHPEIYRYFMLISEACKLVLEAGTLGNGGEIFVFDMGKPVKILDLAKRMIKLSGAENIEIKFTGLRDGEKLYEEVLANSENTIPTVHPKILVAKVREYDYEEACANEERLLEASNTFDDMAIVKVMKEIVPEFKSEVSKYQALDC